VTLTADLLNTYCDSLLQSPAFRNLNLQEALAQGLVQRTSGLEGETVWPGNLNAEEFVTQEQDGSWSISSLDGATNLRLAASLLAVRVEFPVQVAASLAARQSQIHSLATLPPRWAHPLALLLSVRGTDPSELRMPVAACLLSPSDWAEELVAGREYRTELPAVASRANPPAELDQTLLSGLSQASRFSSDLQQLDRSLSPGQKAYEQIVHGALRELAIQEGKAISELLASNPYLRQLVSHDALHSSAVWTQDDVAPSTSFYDYPSSAPLFEWSPDCLTRVLGTQTAELEVAVHEDDSVFWVKEGGNFVNHLASNLLSEPVLRSFTGDTVPFQVQSHLPAVRLKPQLLLAPAFLMLEHFPPEMTAAQTGSSPSEQLQKASLMAAGADSVVREVEVPDLGKFQAYANGAVRVLFKDRTIVRLMKDCQIARVLSRRGDEFSINLAQPSASVLASFEQHLQVAKEFFDYVFTPQELKQARQQAHQSQQEAVQAEVERIQRTIKLADSLPAEEQQPVERADWPERRALEEVESNCAKISEIEELLARISE
jgi:hypothetical protein